MFERMAVVTGTCLPWKEAWFRRCLLSFVGSFRGGLFGIADESWAFLKLACTCRGDLCSF